MKTITLLAIVSNLIASSAYALPKTKLTAPAARPDRIAHSIEQSMGQELTNQQLESLNSIVEGYASYSEQPQQASDLMVRTAIFCGGAVAGVWIGVQYSFCTDTNGKAYYMIGKMVGAVGAAAEAFAFIVNRDRSEPIRPNFTSVSFASSTGGVLTSKLFSVLNALSNIAPFIGPKLGLYHSILGNQGGIMVGARVGKIAETVAYTSLDIFETREEAFAAAVSLDTYNPFGPKQDLQKKWESLPRPQIRH